MQEFAMPSTRLLNQMNKIREAEQLRFYLIHFLVTYLKLILILPDNLIFSLFSVDKSTMQAFK